MTNLSRVKKCNRATEPLKSIYKVYELNNDGDYERSGKRSVKKKVFQLFKKSHPECTSWSDVTNYYLNLSDLEKDWYIYNTIYETVMCEIQIRKSNDEIDFIKNKIESKKEMMSEVLFKHNRNVEALDKHYIFKPHHNNEDVRSMYKEFIHTLKRNRPSMPLPNFQEFCINLKNRTSTNIPLRPVDYVRSFDDECSQSGLEPHPTEIDIDKPYTIEDIFNSTRTKEYDDKYCYEADCPEDLKTISDSFNFDQYLMKCVLHILETKLGCRVDINEIAKSMAHADNCYINEFEEIGKEFLPYFEHTEKIKNVANYITFNEIP